MKKGSLLFGMFVIVIALSFLTTHPVHAAPIVNFPVTVTQPDGTKLNLFASGDEYYNWLADAQGYTVIQDPVSGDYVYANLVGGKLVPTKFVAGRVNPASVGLQPYLNISPAQKTQIRQAFVGQTKQAAGQIKNAPHTGTINNLVVFIRFSGEAAFTTPTSTFTGMLNNSTAGANSLRNYYLEASYNLLTINSTLLPTPGSTPASYQDSHARGYYQPYNASTNTIGYTGGDSGTDRRLREHTLLRDAITYVNGLGLFSGISVDGDNDGVVDGLTFIVSGSPTGWSSLLWPHQWSLYTYTVTINGKAVENYSFHLNDFLITEGTGVLAHEMFHALDAPDLYHYSGDGFAPVGAWDVMENTQNPPQHMGCYMKATYGLWISSIPVLSAPGTYTLNPLTSSTNNCYKIASPNSATEYFVVEYRRATGPFESSLPGTGLLVYRINTLVSEGNRNGPPDEVYIYRPGGTLSVNGSVNTANFSSTVGRTAINDSTNPSSFLSNGSAGGLNLCNIGASGATISFDICGTTTYANKIFLPLIMTAAPPPGSFSKTAPANGAAGQPANPSLSWAASSGATSYEYCYDTSNDNACSSWTSTGTSTSVGLSGLAPATYYWQVRANNSGGTTVADGGTWWSFTTTSSPAGPMPGYWRSSAGYTNFYVTPGGTIVRKFTITVGFPCGTYSIFRTNPAGDVSISGNQFSFSGTFNASGTFDSSTTAHGTSGLSNYGPVCGSNWDGGPWSWSATWQDSSQPAFMSAITESGFVEAAPGTTGAPIAIPVK